MKESLLLSLVQLDIQWKDPVGNRAILEEKILGLEEKGDIIILPETFTTGFCQEVAEVHGLHTQKWLQQMAQNCQAAICGSYLVKEGNLIYNRFLWIEPNGSLKKYDKRHLFCLGEEKEKLTAGSQKLSISYLGWKLSPFICYDLRFPVWSRNTGLENDILLYVANWPSARQQVWETLLAARAIENSAYCIGVNRVGKDGQGILYQGGSQIYFPTGKALFQTSNKEETLQVRVSKNVLNDYRKRFPFHEDADAFTLHTH